jgi:hypothetical protein
MHAEPDTNATEAVQFAPPPPPPPPPPPQLQLPVLSQASVSAAANVSASSSSSSVAGTSQSLLGGMFAPSSMASAPQFADLGGRPERAHPAKPPPLCLATDASSSIFSAAPAVTAERQPFAPPPPSPSPSAHMSATALLQKAAQMGATSSSSSFLRGLGLDVSSSSPGASSSGQQQQQHHEAMRVSLPDASLQQWPPRLELEPAPMLSAGLGLALPYDSTGAQVSLPELMMGQSSLFSGKPATLDFLGLGMSPSGASAGRGLPAFVQPIGGAVGGMAGTGAGAADTFGAGRGAQATPWERNPSSSPIL